MILLLDIGNTHTHVGLADECRVRHHFDLPTAGWFAGPAGIEKLRREVGQRPIAGAAVCSVVPRATQLARRAVRRLWGQDALTVTPRHLPGIGVNYPRPATIGPDRLANAVAVRHHYGAPAIVIDFGTAVTFDVLDARSNYVGGIIAPGLAAMTDYLHEKTALLPRIRIREVDRVIGRSTGEAMRIGAVRGYRGLVRELLAALRRELGSRTVHVVATGGYARLMAAGLPGIQAVDPLLTLEGIRLIHAHEAEQSVRARAKVRARSGQRSGRGRGRL